MAVLFSEVTVTANGEQTEFLTGGGYATRKNHLNRR